MRINEVFEHEPLLPYQETDCPSSSCEKTGTHCVDITLPVTVTPTATPGTVTTTCQGTPRVTCTASDDGRTATFTITQRVCVSIPVRFSVTTEPLETTIACAGTDTDDDDGCGCLM